MKPLPHDTEAETALLGAMMLSERAIPEVTEVVKAGDLYEARHRTIFEAMLALYGRSRSVDQVTVVDELRQRKALDTVGGALYIAELAREVPMAEAAASYARIVAETATRRAFIDAARSIEKAAFDDRDVDDLIEQAEKAVFQAARRDDNDAATMAEDAVIEALAAIGSPDKAGTPTGFRDLDDILGGLRPGSLIVIAARPGVGKSSFVTNVARNFAFIGRAVAMWSLEMSDLEIGERLLAHESRVSVEALRGRQPKKGEDRALSDAVEAFAGKTYWILDNAAVTLIDIRGRARRFQATRGLDLIIIDYLQLMSSVEKSKSKNREQEIAEISRGLKALAKELAIPVIAVSQLNRDPERRQGKRPQLSDLRESGAIEQDADIVIFIHEDEEKPRIREFIVAKNRTGKKGSAKLVFLPDTTTFLDYAEGS